MDVKQQHEQRIPSSKTPLPSLFIVSEQRTLTIEERGQELTRLFGFNHLILTRRLNPDSLRVYCRDFYAYLEFATSREQALQPATLARWMTYLSEPMTLSPLTGKPYSPNTINRMATAVRRIMREAGNQGYLDPDIVKGFHDVEGASRKALKGRLRRYNRVRITPEQMRQITEQAGAEVGRLVGLRNWALLLTLSTSGLRVETFRTLTQEQLVYRSEQERHVLSVRSKNELEARDVPLSPEAYAAIQEWLLARPITSPYIFTRFDGRGEGGNTRLSDQPLSAFSVRTVVQRAAATVGIPHVKTHDFRRFVGTVVAKLHGYKQAQHVLGHKDAATTLNNYVLEELEPGVTDHLF